MQVILYNNNSDRNQVSKNIHQIATIDCRPYDTLDILHPVLIMRKRDITFNYFYIPLLNRYYFLSSCQLETGEELRIEGNVDVLMSFRKNLKMSEIIAERSYNHGNGNLPDSAVACEGIPKRYARKIVSSPFTGKSYVLIVGGR